MYLYIHIIKIAKIKKDDFLGGEHGKYDYVVYKKKRTTDTRKTYNMP